MNEPRRSHLRRLRSAACTLLALGLLAGCTIGTPVAVAANIEGGNSFNELATKAQEQEPTTSTEATTGTEKEVHNSNKTIFIGLGAAVVLLGAIAFVIVRDARRVAPAGAEEMAEASSAGDRAVRHRNRRAKARAAKSQRKKNR